MVLSDEEEEDVMMEDYSENSGINSGLDMTSFLFGNVDKDGKLNADFLDKESKEKLSGLSTLMDWSKGFKEELIKETEDEDLDGEVKTESTGLVPQDYSDIQEVLSVDDSSSSSESGDETSSSTAAVKTENIEATQESRLDEIIKNEKEFRNQDSDLMPPPTIPLSKVKKPLAGMLPEKYKDVDVRTIFPEFRANQVLRFSRLFSIKPSHKPKIWKGVKKRKQKVKEEGLAVDAPPVKKSRGWAFDFGEYPEDPEAYIEDQSVRFHRPQEEIAPSIESTTKEGKENDRKGPRHTDWRMGPAQYWYDMLDLPEIVEDDEYTEALLVKAPSGEKNETSDKLTPPSPPPQNSNSNQDLITKGAFFMVAQSNWEEDVVWNGDDIKNKVLHKLNSKSNNAAGWVPSTYNRTAGSFSHSGKSAMPGIKLQTLQQKRNGDDTWYSIFPVENEELVYGRWEDEVIWNSDKMPDLKPKIVSLDSNDDNIIFGIPEDIDPATLPSDEPVRKIKIIQKHVKQSRMLLNRSGIISVIEEESPPPPPKMDDTDPFNISNDKFYQPKTQESLKVSSGRTLLQHATPVVELQAPFVPTHIGPIKLRLFHRPPLKRFSKGPLADYTGYYGVLSLQKHMKKKAKARESERELAGGGEIFFMRTPEDVSGKDGELILFEFIEEHAPLHDLVGMCSKIKNYYKKKSDDDKGPESLNEIRYGENTLAHSSPFLGTMYPGQTVRALENNMFRAPIFEHSAPMTDFVIIRTRNEYSIREADSVFVVGQECPLYEVPGPNSKLANNFTRDFLQVFIYRLFWKSKDNPRRIKMDEIKKAFPAHSESSIRKRLKPCAEFHRTGHDSNWWVIKANFRLPTEEEIRSKVDPEACCAYFSMIAAEQRLRDAGYGEKFLLAQQEEDDEDTAVKMDDEVKVAPWNTTRAYILAMKGKCLLQLTGPADPTGPAGEGFSYVRIPNKPVNKEEQEQQPKRTVTGTDADLRKLPLKEARAILRSNGVPEKEIMKLSRWEVIDVVRTLSTEKVKAGEDGDHKFSRGNRFSIAEHQERYREDCQRLFDVQNRVLASSEVLSSDEAESSEEEDANDEDFDELGKNLENMLSNKKTSTQFLREREELERRSLQKMIMGEDESKVPPKKSSKKDEDPGEAAPHKLLKIVRTFRSEDGKEYSRSEFVRKPLVIETYIRVRETKDDNFIRQFANVDEAAKEEMKKEKRRIQEQLRRLKRNEEKEKLLQAKAAKKTGSSGNLLQASSPSSLSAAKSKKDLKLVCGACGGKGHMRTNRACPKFIPEYESLLLGTGNVSNDADEEEYEKPSTSVIEDLEDDDDLVNVEGTKVKLSGKILLQAEAIRRESMKLKIPKQPGKGSKKRSKMGAEHCDYLASKSYRPSKRRRTDPVITLASYLERVLNELRVMDEALQFLQPVSAKRLPTYHDIVKTPMDLQTIRENIQTKKYNSREEFLADIHQIVANSVLFNGEEDIHTNNARKILEVVIAKFAQNEVALMSLEKAINPLLDDDQIALTYIFDSILNERIKTLQESWPFIKPVNKKQNKTYYEVVKTPMDLETIAKRVSANFYTSRNEFQRDIGLLYSNSLAFNGENSEFTLKAKKILDITISTLNEYSDHLESLEAKIKKTQRVALEQSGDIGDDDDDDEEPSSESQKKKRGRPRKKKGHKVVSSEFIDVESERPANEASGGVLEEDLQYSSEEDWEEVVEEESQAEEGGFTVAIDPEPPIVSNFYAEANEDVQVDENYDPTDFLTALSKPTYEPPVDIKNDLDISDSDEEEEEAATTSSVPETSAAPQPPDDDALWF